jgi:hypothetical protein
VAAILRLSTQMPRVGVVPDVDVIPTAAAAAAATDRD